MLKKHSFSPGHKVVTGSKHNFHPQGAPTTASQGQPPQQMPGAGGDGTQAPQEGQGGMDGMNFCNGGAKYADGGDTKPDIMGGGVRGTLSDYGNAVGQTASDAWDKMTKPNPVASGNTEEPYEGVGGAARKAAMDAKERSME
jgi:hypothetical protein